MRLATAFFFFSSVAHEHIRLTMRVRVAHLSPVIGILWSGHSDPQLTPMIDPGGGISADTPSSATLPLKCSQAEN